MHRCCVLGCGTKAGEKSFPVSFHPFPSGEELSLKQEWIEAVGRINWEPALSSRVCSMHFKDEDFQQLKKAKRLKKAAVPSINVGLCDTLKTAKMSGKECVIPTCTSKFSEAPYFHFPKEKSLCVKWLLAIPKGGWSLNQDSQICSRHFENADVVANEAQAWLKTGSVPKLYLESPTVLSAETSPPEPKNEVTIEKTEVILDTGNASADNAAPVPSKVPEESCPITSQDVDLVEEGNGIFKIKLDADDGSESDLEIIEPEIETYEVSDTSDEGEPPPKPAPPPAAKGPVLTSLKLQVNEIHNNLPKSNILIKPQCSSNGRVIRGDSKIKCCVPRCGSMAGKPPGVGFHSFPLVGETRLSVRSLDNKLTVHDLFSMWKSLLSVPTITKDSYVCTRHFTPNDYNGNVLNKVAVPTQFLPTPVTFAPCKVQEKPIAVNPPPLVLLNKSKNPPPILKKPNKPSFSYASPPIRFPGIPSVNNVSSLTRVATNRVEPGPLPSKNVHRMAQQNTSRYNLQKLAPKTLQPLVRPAPLPVPKKSKLGCSIPNCPNKQQDENVKAVLFRLPHNIEKCKEWVYSCGHPEWLDKGMVIARSMFRICSLHFENEMFLDPGHKTLKGSAKPTVAVQEPYKKCTVKHCHNYYDKERLHYIGVDFATFPTEPNIFKSWVKAVKNNTGVYVKSIKVTDEDVKNFTGAMICSLHFRNSDYVAGPSGKSLSPNAIPSMNLVSVKESEVSTPAPEATKEPDAPQPAAQSTETEALQSPIEKRQCRRPYLGRRRRKKMRGRQLGLMRSKGAFNKKDDEGDNEQTEINDAIEKEGPELAALGNKETGDQSSNLPVDGQQGASNEGTAIEGDSKASEEKLPPAATKRGRPFRRQRVGRRSKNLSVREESDEELREQSDDNERGSKRRSSRIETLYGPRGRPLRSAVLKRKTVIESGSGSQGSDEEPVVKKRGRPKSSVDDYNSDVSVQRNLRPRRAAASKKFVMDDSESGEGNKSDDEWQQDGENDAPMDYGGGVAESGHFLDPVLGVEHFPALPAEDTSAQPAEDASAQPAEDASDQPAEDASVQPAEDASVQPAEDASVQPAEDTSDQPAEDASAQPAEDTSAQPAENIPQPADQVVAERIDLNVADQQMEDVTMSDVEGRSSNEIEESTDQKSNCTAETANKANTKDASESEVKLDNNPETSGIDNAAKENDSNDVEGEPVAKDDTTGNDMESSDILDINDTSDAPKEINKENIDKEPVELQAPESGKTGELEQSSEDKENIVPFGPKLPIPTRADIEFFRSIIPSMASFSHFQKSEFRSTIISTLKEMLNEDLSIEINMKPIEDNPVENSREDGDELNPETDDSVKNDSHSPHLETIEST